MSIKAKGLINACSLIPASVSAHHFEKITRATNSAIKIASNSAKAQPLPEFSLFSEQALRSLPRHYWQPSPLANSFCDFMLGFKSYNQLGVRELVRDPNYFFAHFKPNCAFSTALFPTQKTNDLRPNGFELTLQTKQEFRQNPLLRAAHKKVLDYALASFGMRRQGRQIGVLRDIQTEKPLWLKDNGSEERALLMQIIVSLHQLGNHQVAKNLAMQASNTLSHAGLFVQAAKFAKAEQLIADFINKKSRTPIDIIRQSPTLIAGKNPDLKTNLSPDEKTALFNYANSQFLSRAEVLTLYDYFGGTIVDFSSEELTLDDYFMLLGKGFIKLSQIPTSFISRELCLHACLQHGVNIFNVPPQWQDEDMWHVACSKNPHLIPQMPKAFLSYELIKQIEYINQETFDILPDSYLTFEICKKALENISIDLNRIKNHPQYQAMFDLINHRYRIRLKELDESERTEILCKNACEIDGKQLELVPAKFKTFELCLSAVKSSYLALKYLPPNLTESDLDQLYERACRHNINALSLIPEHKKSFFLCKIAAQAPGAIIKAGLFPHSLGLHLDECFALLCKQSAQNLTKIPNRVTQENCYSAVECKDFNFKLVEKKFWNDKLWYLANRRGILSEENFDYDVFSHYRHLIKYLPKHLQKSLLAKATPAQKLDLINFIIGLENEASLISDTEKLIDTKHPLVFKMDNHFISGLVENAYSSTPIPLRLKQIGEQLTANVKSQTLSIATELELGDLLTHNPYEMVGGRTLSIKQSNSNCLYVKFKKFGESKDELFKEARVYDFIHQNEVLKNRLKSKLPQCAKVKKIRLTPELEAVISQSEDKIEIIKEQNLRYVYALTFEATENYSRYAYKLDNTDSNPYAKPEQGIKNACHDLGLLASMGLVLPSLLPAFHDTETQRRWVALHSAFNHNNNVHPGTFGAWNTTATARPDFGYDGVRDLGDHEMFGELKTYFEQKDTKQVAQIHPHRVSQRLGFANAVCESLLSATIIRSRLRQQGDSYHYRITEAINETKNFIKQIGNEFLEGFYQIADTHLLQKVMNLSNELFEQWLTRAATEIVFWTAAQYGKDPSNLPEKYYKDCYLNNMKRYGFPSNKLFSDINIFNFADTIDPCDFINADKKLNLGGNNKVFPLVTLMNGLTLLSANIFAFNKDTQS